ncbi:MAG: type III-B CRISPR module RAMP protein Cmr4 [Ardenticatenales bacterium]|nr:type III-B CRISPR module RAMP protein Cmr4 [Ardenticatenales bacterium]
MFEQKTMMYLYVETPLHAGAGAGVGLVDLPIQRERVTGYPMINSGGIKGALRGVARPDKGASRVEKQKWFAAFGPPPPGDEESSAETQKGHDYAGALAFGDARLLLFPVRSMRGIFAWTTSRDLLCRFQRDAMTAGFELPWQVPEAPGARHKAWVGKDNDITTDDSQLVLEEFQFEGQPDPRVDEIGQWLARYALPPDNVYGYWRERLPRALTILPEDAFRDFTQYGTEVITRVQLHNEKKTVQAGPWVEEHLPTDTLMYVPVHASRARFDPRADEARQTLQTWSEKGGGREIMSYLTSLPLASIQLGGDMTVGRGQVRLRFQEQREV